MIRRLGAAIVGTPVLALLIATPAAGTAPGASTGPTFTPVNQVSNAPGMAKVTDRKLVNAWGLASSPTSPLWGPTTARAPPPSTAAGWAAAR